MCVFQDTWTAVHRAASAEHADCSVEIIKIVVTTLMAREANLQSVAEYVNMRDQSGLTTLHSAVLQQSEAHRGVVEYLLQECGADPNTHENEKGNTPLHDAIEGRDTAMIAILLRHNANVNEINEEHKTCLDFANEQGIDLSHC